MLTDQPHHSARLSGATPLHIESTARVGRRVVTLQGELDTTNADQLRNVLNDILDDDLITLRNDGATPAVELVVIDLAQLTFLAAAGLNVLAESRRRVRAAGARLVLIRPTPFALRILCIVGLDDLLALEDG
jgi:anti-anti-sigma factor